MFISDPGAIKSLLVGGASLSGVSEVRSNMRRLLGDRSTFLLDGDAHIRRRRLVLPPFHGAALNNCAQLTAQMIEGEIATWRLSEPIPLRPKLHAASLEVILQTVLGSASDELVNQVRRLAPALGRVRHPIAGARHDRRDELIGESYSQANDAVNEAMSDEIRRRRALDKTIIEEIRTRRARPSGIDDGDVLSLLVSARDENGAPLEEQEVRAELRTLIGAGYETTGATLAWTLEFLLRDDRALELATEDALIGDGAYLRAAISEALRIQPPAPLITRTLMQPWRLGDRELPAGTDLAPCIYLVHRRPDLYPDPDVFRPERFLESAPETYSWLPFGGGVRRCLGASFAELEMQVMLRTLLSTLELELVDRGPPGTGCWRGAVLTPRGPTEAVVRVRPGH